MLTAKFVEIIALRPAECYDSFSTARQKCLKPMTTHNKVLHRSGTQSFLTCFGVCRSRSVNTDVLCLQMLGSIDNIRSDNETQ